MSWKSFSGVLKMIGSGLFYVAFYGILIIGVKVANSFLEVILAIVLTFILLLVFVLLGLAGSYISKRIRPYISSYIESISKKIGMEKLNENRYVVIIALLILSGAFYWFQYRPSEIKKTCDEVAKNEAARSYGNREKNYDFKYRQCLRENGL
jgi:hypothetical protein